VDDNGDIYVTTENGPNNPQFALDQMGESVAKLTWNPGNPGSLVLDDWFTPFYDNGRDVDHCLRSGQLKVWLPAHDSNQSDLPDILYQSDREYAAA
jgi:hypothetical protein